MVEEVTWVIRFLPEWFCWRKDIAESESGLEGGQTELDMRGRAKGLGRRKVNYRKCFE